MIGQEGGKSNLIESFRSYAFIAYIDLKIFLLAKKINLLSQRTKNHHSIFIGVDFLNIRL
jgi:hypothetical protein